MSSDSSSSRESSPTRFHPGTPGSDADGVTHSSWQPSAPAFHPSASYQASQSSNAPVLRQPVGFGTSPPSVPTYHAPPPETSTSAQHYLPGQNPPSEEPASKSRKKSTKSKDKETSSKSSSRKGKDAEKTPASGHTVAAQPYPSPAAPPIQKTAFRVRSYSNDPTAVGSPYTIQDGPYGAAYRAELPDRPVKTKTSKKKSRSTVTEAQAAPPPAQPQAHAPPLQGHPAPPHYYPSHAMQQPPHPQSYPQQPPYQYPPQQQPAQDLQPRSSYYRYDYEKIRQSAPTRQAQAQAQAQAQSSAPPAHPPQHHYSHPVPPPPPGEHYSNSSRSNKRNDAHAYPHEYQYPPPADYHYREPSPPPPPPGDYYGSPPPQPPPAYPPAYPPSYPASYPAPYAPTPSHSPDKEKRHKSKSRSHRQEHPSSAPPPPGYAPAPHIPDAPPPAIRVCRILTLLIEDKRDPNGESLLAEVRVPLKPAEPGDEGFWADAQEVSEELQRGPSRIDGAAKVYTLRGKYKQYFLRITADGEPICQPANLKVTPERTVEIYIEENLPPGGKAIDTHSSPPRLQRELLTPMTDSMTSPSPAPVPSPPKRSSLFSVDLGTPTEDKFDSSAYMASAALEARRKRPRSSSMQSVQSVQSALSEDYTIQTQRDGSPSPSSPPEETSSSPQSRTQSETPPASQCQGPASIQPMSQPREVQAPATQQTQTMATEPTPQSPEPSAPSAQAALAASTFPTVQSASTPARSLSSSYLPGPSPPKKAKLLVPQSDTRTEKSVSPGPSQTVAYPWSNSRTPSFSDSSAPSISKGTKTGLSASSSSPSNPFAQYQSNFSLSGRPLETVSRSVSTPGISIPSLSTVSIAPTATMTPPATLAPSAISRTPTLSGAATSALDNAVGMWIKGIISKEPQWDTFVKNRSRVLKMSEQLEQYKYVQRVIDRYEGSTTPADLEGAGGVKISKAQVMRAFNLPLSWGEDCTETLVLTTLYGPGGTRCEDARVCAMLEETPPITTGMQAKKYLTLLREVHGQWTIAHPDGP